MLAEQYIALFSPDQMAHLLAALGGAIEPGLKREIIARLRSQLSQARGGVVLEGYRGLRWSLSQARVCVCLCVCFEGYRRPAS